MISQIYFDFLILHIKSHHKLSLNFFHLSFCYVFYFFPDQYFKVGIFILHIDVLVIITFWEFLYTKHHWTA